MKVAPELTNTRPQMGSGSTLTPHPLSVACGGTDRRTFAALAYSIAASTERPEMTLYEGQILD